MIEVGQLLRYGASPSTQYVRVLALTPKTITVEGVDQLKLTPITLNRKLVESNLEAFGTI